MNEPRSSLPRDLLIIVAVVAFVGVPSLFTRDLWPPDETRYCEVAREMAATHDYVVPHLNGDVYSGKGPVFFWLAAGFWKLGAGFLSGRLVTLLSVAGTLVLLYLAFRKVIGEKGALLGAVCALTTFLLFQFVRLGVIDSLLTFTVTAAMVSGFFAMLPETRRRGAWWVLCYAAMALGVLNKGPVGFVVPALPLLVYGILDRKRIRPGGWWHLAGAAVLVLIVAAWVVPACIAGGKEYTDTILVRQHVSRTVESYGHAKPVYFYLLKSFSRFAPWVLIVPVALVAAVRAWRRTGEQTPLLAAMWFLVPILFLSIISGKRPNYVLPVTPALGLLCGWYFTSKVRQEPGFRRAETWMLRITCGLAALVILVLTVGILALKTGACRLPLTSADVDRQLTAGLSNLTPWRVALGLPLSAILLGLCVLAFFLVLRNAQRAIVALAAAVMLMGVLGDFVVTPAFHTEQSGRRLGEVVNKNAGPTGRVFLFHAVFDGLYNLYTGRVTMPVIRDEKQLRDLLEQPDVLVITTDEHARQVLGPERLKEHTIYTEGQGHDTTVVLQGIPPAHPEQ